MVFSRNAYYAMFNFIQTKFRNRIFLSDCSQLQTSHTVCSDSALSGQTSKLGILAQKMIISPDQLSSLRSLISVFSVSMGILNSQ